MRKPSVQRKLEAGEGVSGMFAPIGAEFATPGLLTWSPEEGAMLELVDRGDPWPSGRDGFTVHGTPYDGDRLTLLDCHVRRWSMMDVTTHVGSWTVAIGEHMEPSERWVKANYRPATLHEWIADTGLDIDRRDDGAHVIVEWKAPERRVIRLDDAEVSIYPTSDWAWSYSPDWEIKTAMTFGVTPTEPLTIAEFQQRFGHPLLCFSSFASDRADGLLLESYYDPETRRRVAMMRTGQPAKSPDWRPGNDRFLFQAEHVDDEADTIRRWFEIWRASVPALGLFYETMEDASTFSAPRFLTLWTAAENYWKRVHGGRWNLQSLVDYAGVDVRLTGVTKTVVAVMGATRKFHAHLEATGPLLEEDQPDQTYESTRRLHVLLQACLMRDLGMPTETIEERLDRHYRAWPMP